jgi:ATP-dependent helicase/nuclease subunit B
VLVPNHRAGLDFARVLAHEAGRPALVPPRITPLKTWAETAAGGLPRPEPHARRLARLHGVLRGVGWLGAVDKWALASELLQLADELSAARLGSELGARLRGVHGGHLDRETALVEAVWQALNGDGSDPSSCYARALDALFQEVEAHPRAIYGYALGTLTPAEQQFLERCATLAPLTLFEASPEADPLTLTLSEAWGTSEPPLRERAAALARRLPSSPLLAAVRVCAASHLEGEARAVAAWVGEQLHTGRRDIALIALDREAARRVRALLERLDVLAADETGWTLSTTAAAAVVDRWLECVANEFPHVEMLDLLKSPFLLGALAERQDDVLRFELALRRAGVSQGLADLQRVAQQQFSALPRWLAALFDARQGFARSRATLATWLTRLDESLARLDAIEPLNGDAAGASLLGTLTALARDLAGDDERYTFSEWRRWLNLALESASFVDARVASPVVLTSLPAARGRRFEAVAVIGCDARRLPAAPRPGLFSQATRAQLGLATAADDAREAVDDLLRLLAQGPALLSWQAWHEDEPNPASPLVLRLQALHRAAWGTALAEQASFEPPSRASPLPAPAAAPRPVVPAARLPRRYSPTAYQTLLDCPYRFFVTGVLGIRELEEADEALDKSDYGNALHRILKAFHDSDPEPERVAALERLDAVSAREFAALPAYTATAWETRWRMLQPAYVDAWLAWHGEGWRYRSGEAEFSAAVAVDGLGEVTLHGRVDRVDARVDAAGEEALAVIDFKTSSAQGLKRRLGDPGEAVQLPFYGWLASAAAAYLPVNEAPVAPLALAGETDVDAIVRRLPALLEAIAAGTPLPAGGIDAVCHHCEVRGVCRKGMWEPPPA